MIRFTIILNRAIIHHIAFVKITFTIVILLIIISILSTMQCIIDVLSSWYSLKRADIVAPSNIKCDWFWLAYDISKVLYYCTLIVVKQSL